MSEQLSNWIFKIFENIYDSKTGLRVTNTMVREIRKENFPEVSLKEINDCVSDVLADYESEELTMGKQTIFDDRKLLLSEQD